jgi:hypothetical protein
MGAALLLTIGPGSAPAPFFPPLPHAVRVSGNPFANKACQFFKESLQDAAKRHDLAIDAYGSTTNHIHSLPMVGSTPRK